MIDCHAHLADEDPDDNARVLRVIAEGDAAGREAMTRLLPCLGFHPDCFADDRPPPTRAVLDAAIAQIRKHRNDISAIGEVGLDYWWVKDPERRRVQRSLLEEMAALSTELDLPLNVHSRSAGHYTVDLLLASGARWVLMHAFDGKASHAVRAAEAGYLFSVPPSVVRSDQKQKLVRRLPLESLALESDSPVLGPERDRRNEPANLTFPRDFIAEVHGFSPDRVDEVTTANAKRLFPLLTTSCG